MINAYKFRLWDRWQRIRRHPDYLAFCEKHRDHFDERGILPSEIACKDPGFSKIYKQFGLRFIVHPQKVNPPPEEMLTRPHLQLSGLLCSCICPPVIPHMANNEGVLTGTWENHPIWGGRYLRLEINLEAKLDEIIAWVTQYYHEGKENQSREHLQKRAQCYEIWDLRKKRLSYKDIALKLNIRPDTARKSYYKAWQLIMGFPYVSEKFTKLKTSMVELKKLCATCSERDHCTDLCPEAAIYVNQDYVSPSEILPTNDNLLYSITSDIEHSELD